MSDEPQMSMGEDIELDDTFLAQTSPALVEKGPRQRRAVAQPVRLDSNPRVICYQYQHTQAQARWQGYTAMLQYFLPEGWSPAYKYSVFEDSYVLRFDDGFVVPHDSLTEMDSAQQQFYLARPLHTKRTNDAHQSLAEFELVWPMQLDRVLLDTVHRECGVVHLGSKRKPQHALSLSTVHLKLQRLDL